MLISSVGTAANEVIVGTEKGFATLTSPSTEPTVTVVESLA
jgi:hypothetical protein